MKSLINITKTFMNLHEYETMHFQIVFYLIFNEIFDLSQKYMYIRKLKKKKVNITAYNYYNNIYYGLTIIHILAILNMHKEILIFDLTNENLDLPALETKKTPLDLAIEYYSYDAIRYLIKSEKININNCYLIKCIKNSSPHSTIKFLVVSGADINQKDNNGKNALYYAYILDRKYTKLYLKSKGAVYDESKLYKIVRLFEKKSTKIKNFFPPMYL